MEQKTLESPRRSTGWDSGSEPCPLCEGRGYIFWRAENGELLSRDCRCEVRRRNRRRLERSGLAGLVDRYTFERYETPEPWQQTAREAAERYLADWRGKWFFMGGTSGAGKTHLCTAICGRLMEAGIPLRYMQWRSDTVPLKAAVTDGEAYRAQMEPLKKVKALYIDDFLKDNRVNGNLATFKNEAAYFWIVDAREYNNSGKLVDGSTAEVKPENVPQAAPGVAAERKATGVAKSFDKKLAGAYTVTAGSGLHIRNVAGSKTGSMIVLPHGTKVQNYGYYTEVNGVKWLYIQVTYQGVKYTGFSSGEWLKKV